jgi:tetratricopeptide (TPR) repeat protein
MVLLTALGAVVMRSRVEAATVRLLPPPPASASPAVQRDRDIALYSARAERDPISAADRSQLAGLYLDRARETGSFTDLARAEESAQTSLTLRDAHNTRTAQLLASIYLAEHKFTPALEAARRLASENPEVATFRALYGECQLEVGDYAGADTTFAPLARAPATLAVAPRVARWHEINGRTDRARQLLQWARKSAHASVGLSAEQVAWFELRVGDLELRNGNLAAADSAFQAAIAAHSGDYRVLALMTRLEMMRGNPTRAIVLGESAIATVLDPATLGMLADAYTIVGDSIRAAEYAQALQLAVASQPGSYHRAWSLWLLDHERDVTRVSQKVRKELNSRRDVYGLDLYAWALHRQGRDQEARGWSARALSRGTKDAQLLSHAAAIEHAIGDSAAAARHHAEALAINRYIR